ncbi:MAG: hypothetical protein ABI036_08715, partial [Fibrobacteria bacterium]
EAKDLSTHARAKLARVRDLFRETGMEKGSLAASSRAFFTALGVPFGLRHHKVPEGDLEALSGDAFEDTCHASNILPVTQADMLTVYKAAF